MKNEHFVNPPSPEKRDLLESSLAYLEKEELSAGDLEIMEQYVGKMGIKSPYMMFLEQSEGEELDGKMEC
jgi:hypothetical protein